ncbi:C2 family cysteine protease [Brachybacterium sp. GCM10030267]|uniref:C2 family cysteine protease n=1 Tax=unclassified Brachybacterium TaxID=2623841 RepID=UPI00360FF57B
MAPDSRPRVRTWRRTLRALALTGRAREAYVPATPGLGPRAAGWRQDTGPLAPPRLLRPRQGRLGDCWLLAAMLAIHETAPERLAQLLSALPDGTVEMHLPALGHPIRVDRMMPVDDAGEFLYARRDGANPGWAGALEKAITAYVAGGYGYIQRGFARFGFELLLGMRVRTLLRLPPAAQLAAWTDEGRAVAASTHPLSGLVTTAHGRLPPNHVFAVVGADPRSGHVRLRNPVRPGRLLVVDARTFRRGFLSLDVTPPLR